MAAAAGSALLTTDGERLRTQKEMKLRKVAKKEASTESGAGTMGGADANWQSLRGGMRFADMTVGSGAIPVKGRKLKVRYEGRLANGKVFDSNVTGFSFRLGMGEVIKGWDVGLESMRAGGRRLLAIPPNMAYGAAGAGPIPPNAALLFDVELLSC